MTNYAQAEIMSPDSDLLALQTAQGGALLFSIGTDGSLYATVENAGTKHGWSRANLSAAQVAKDFPSASEASCVRFSAAQAGDGTIRLAMALRVGENDYLYVSLGNSSEDTSWTADPNWTPVPYDDASYQRSRLVIVGLFISKSTDGEYIVADVLRDPASAASLIFRYYINPRKANGAKWNPHDVAVDIAPGKYQSCLGRKANQGMYPLDGIVTCGQINGKAQLLYAPLYNAFRPGRPPNPDILYLPAGGIADAIATCRNPDNTADLYTASNGALYWFSSDNQENAATGVLALQNELFNGVRSLFAFLASATQVVVWGLNSSDQIFYTTCQVGSQSSPGAWSVPVPILNGVEQLSPFANRAYSANCFFAHTGNSQLVKAVKSPGTTLWTFQSVTLPPPTITIPARSFSSYTTRIQVTDSDGKPASDRMVQLSATNVAPVTINHLYYLLSPRPITVATDLLGCITIVEAVDSIQGSRLTVRVGDASMQINPMEKPFNTSAALDTPDALLAATIRYQDGRSRKLVPPETSADSLAVAVTTNQSLAKAYQSVAAPVTVTPRPAVAGPESDNLLIDIGDALAWLGHRIAQGIRDSVQFVSNAAEKIWSLIIKIEGKIYEAVLSTVEAVVKAATWVYEHIKVAIKDVIDFLKFLFDVEDLKRTKAVLKNTTKLFLQHELAQIPTWREEFDGMIADAERAVNGWADRRLVETGVCCDGTNDRKVYAHRISECTRHALIRPFPSECAA